MNLLASFFQGQEPRHCMYCVLPGSSFGKFMVLPYDNYTVCEAVAGRLAMCKIAVLAPAYRGYALLILAYGAALQHHSF